MDLETESKMFICTYQSPSMEISSKKRTISFYTLSYHFNLQVHVSSKIVQVLYTS